MDFSQRLLELRKKAGLSQEELANLLNVTRQAVQKWEAGTSRPDMDNLTALAKYFSVTLDWLVAGEEPPAPEPAAQVVTVVRAGTPVRMVVGAILLTCGILAAVLLFIMTGDFGGFLLPSPLVLGGIACLAVKRHPALACCWAVWLPVFAYFHYATGIRLWWVFMPWFYRPEMISHVLIGWGVYWLPLLFLLFFTGWAVWKWKKKS